MRANPVRLSARWIVGRARRVSLELGALRDLAATLAERAPDPWPEEYHFVGGEELTLRYLLVLDALNFCFWPGKGRWYVRGPRGERLDGYYALSYGLARAAADTPGFFDPRNLASMSEEALRERLGDIPLLPVRARIVREVGKALLAFGSARSFFAVGSCAELVERVTAHLPSFRDACLYRGRWIPFYKRAQILCSDVHGAFQGEGPGAFPDMDWLTAFADYKLPQLLRAHGALVLCPGLAARIDRHELIPAGSDEEIEIRAATVHAVELLVMELARLGRPARAFEVDWTLWNLSQGMELPHPYHRTITVFY
ncbi:MAG: hypothetical protein GXO72_03565 [Caldiserica bacterium]|nr:hypothetical protein [Caldisericota bacterium]